jgi:hypothetical protein
VHLSDKYAYVLGTDLLNLFLSGHLLIDIKLTSSFNASSNSGSNCRTEGEGNCRGKMLGIFSGVTAAGFLANVLAITIFFANILTSYANFAI